MAICPSIARPRSLSLGENRPGVKTPALFLVQRPTQRYNLSTVSCFFPSRFLSHVLSLMLASDVCPDVSSGPRPKLTGSSCRERMHDSLAALLASTHIHTHTHIYTVHEFTPHGREAPRINRVLSSVPFFRSLISYVFFLLLLQFDPLVVVISVGFIIDSKERKKEYKMEARIIFYTEDDTNFYCYCFVR